MEESRLSDLIVHGVDISPEWLDEFELQSVRDPLTEPRQDPEDQGCRADNNTGYREAQLN